MKNITNNKEREKMTKYVFIFSVITLLILLSSISFASSSNKIYLNTNKYAFGETVIFTVQADEGLYLEISSGSSVFKFVGNPTGIQKFNPEEVGTYTIKLIDEATGRLIYLEDFEVVPELSNEDINKFGDSVSNSSTNKEKNQIINQIIKEYPESILKEAKTQKLLTTNKKEYSVGEEVIITIDSNELKISDLDNVTLSIFTPSNTYSFLGSAKKSISFYPDEQGMHEIQITDETGQTYSIYFNVLYREKPDVPLEFGTEKDTTVPKTKPRTKRIVSIFNVDSMHSGNIVKVKDSKNNIKPTELYFYEKEDLTTIALGIFAKDVEGVLESTNNLTGESTSIQKEVIENKTYDLDLVLDDDSLTDIKLRNLVYKKDMEIKYESLGEKSVSIPNREVGKSFSIDLSGIEIEDALATGIAQGRELWKCADWDFDNQQCLGTWEKYLDLVPGQPYEILLGPNDPGFAETNITIINVQSYPSYRGNWTVKFETQGIANLTITAVNGTTWTNTYPDGNFDLRFLKIICGGVEQNYSWINNSVFIENYSCEETSFEISQTLTKGVHNLQFKFGEEVKYAHNDVNDFKIQSGTTVIDTSSSSVTITAGSEYDAPASLSNAFIRLTGTRLTAVGANNTGATSQDPGEYNAYITNPGNLLTSITFQRYTSPAAYNTKIYWEIVEYIGEPGGDNEIIVRDQNTATQSSGTTMTGTSSSAVDDNDIVVFVTSLAHSATSAGTMDRALYTSEWLAGSDTPQFTRGDGSGTSTVSYAVVEFTGNNWKVQRVEHSYASTTAWETEEITPVEATNRTFGHYQIRTNSGNLDEQGHQVYLFNTSVLYLKLRSSATATQTAVAWLVENNQTQGTPMIVRRYGGSRSSGGGEPDTWTESITEVASLSTSSIMGQTADSSGGGTAVPRGSIGLEITANDTVTLWRSDTGQNQDYYFEVLEWPTSPPDLKPPNITIIEPNPEGVTFQTGFINYTISLDEEGDWCGYSLNGAVNISMDTINNTQYNYTSDVWLQNADYNVVFFCNDTSGNNGTSEVRNFTVAVPTPSITINSPLNTTYFTSTIDFNTTTSIASDWCGYSLDEAANVSMTKLFSNFFSYQDTGVSEGIHVFKVSCNSTFGGMNTSEYYGFNVDLQEPIVLALSPQNYSAVWTNTSTKTLNFSVNLTEANPDTCSLYINGGLDSTQVASAGENNISATLSPGTYTWYVNCSETSGRTGISNMYSLNVIYFDGTIENLENQEINNVSSMTTTDSYSSVIFNSVDLTGIYYLNDSIITAFNYTEVDSDNYSGLNTSAQITLFDIVYTYLPAVLKNGVTCSDCFARTYTGTNFTFNVTYFSSYSATGNAQLDIWDETDVKAGPQSRFPGDQILFYTNYTDTQTGDSINGTGVYCEIGYSDIGFSNMTFNTTSLLYYSNRSYDTPGDYEWNVSCTGSGQSHQNLGTNDTVIVSPLFAWGITSSSFTQSSTHTSVRCMGGVAPTLQTGLEITSLWYRAAGAGTVALSVYYGGTETDPSSATRQVELLSLSASSGWNQFVLNQSLEWEEGQVTWICWKKTGAAAYYSSSSADAGDFYTSHGRHDNGGSNPATSFPTNLNTANFGNFWYAVYAEYTNNSAPTQPTDLFCDGDSACGIEVDSSVTLEGAGSTDLEGDEITYSIEAFLSGSGWTYIGNHTAGNNYLWDTSSIEAQDCISTRTRAIDINGSGNYSSYYTESTCINISHPTYFSNPTLNATLLNHTDWVRFNVTATDNEGINYINATVKYPNGTLRNFTMAHGIGDMYYLDFNDTNTTGDYNITTVLAFDLQNNIDTQDYGDLIFSVKLSYPKPFDLISPVNDTVTGNLQPTFTWEQTIEPHFNNYTLLLDKNESFSSVDYTYNTYAIDNTSLTADFALDANSVYYWRVIAYDNYGASTNSTSDFKITTDTNYPNVTLNKPNNFYINSGYDILFNFTAYDLHGVDTCIVYGNFSGTWGPNETNSTITNNEPAYITTTVSSEGEYDWTVWCNDTSGNNEFAFENRTFTVDATGPIVNVVGPTNNTYENESNTVDFTVSATDTYSDVANCKLYINDTLEYSKAPITEGVEFNFTRFVANGNYEWYVTCEDTNGFITTSYRYNITTDVIDVEGPLINLNYPEFNGFVGNKNVTFNYTPEDATGISNCTMYIDGLENQSCSGPPGYFKNQPMAESGAIIMTGLTGTASLSQEYNTSKAFVFKEYTTYGSNSQDEPDGVTATIEWSNCTGEICNELTATRYASDAENNVVSYSIMQANNIQVQRFTATWSLGEFNINITPSPSLPSNYADRCFVNVHRSTRINSADVNDFAEAEIRSTIASTTNVMLERFAEGTNSPAPGVTEGEIVCFLDNTNVQHFFRNFTEGTAVTENIPISSIDTARSWAYHDHRQADDGVGQNAVYNSITSSTNLALFVDENGASGTNRQPQVSAYVIEFESNMNGSTDYVTVSPGTTDQNIITPMGFEVDSNKTLLRCYNSMAAGGGTAHTRDYWANHFSGNDSIQSYNYRTRTSSQTTSIRCWAIEWPQYTTYYTPGSDVSTCIVENFEANYFNIPNVSEGKHNWSITCVDNSTFDNFGYSSIWNFTVDISDPVVTLNAPANDSFSSTSIVAFNFTPFDLNLEACVLYGDFSGVWNYTDAVNYTVTSNEDNFIWKNIGDGTHIWNVLCNDSSGRSAFYEYNYTIKVDTTPPGYYNVFFAPSTPTVYQPGKYFEFNSSWTDNYNVDTVWFEHNFSGNLVNSTTTEVALQTHSFNISNVAVGSYYYKWYANDSMNNINSTVEYNYIIQKATSEVNLLLDSVSANRTINEDNNVNITGDMITPMFDYLEVYLDGVLINSGNNPLENITYFDTPGIYNVSAVYTQTENYSSSTENYSIIVNDITAPNVTLINPDNDTQIGSSGVTFLYNVTDHDNIKNCTLEIDGAFNQFDGSITKDTTQELSDNFADGNYTWQIYCYDYSDNVGFSELREFELIKSDFILLNVTSLPTYERGDNATIHSISKDIFDSPLETTISTIITTANTTTGWWDLSWNKRMSIEVNETTGANKSDSIIRVNITGLNNNISSCENEIRIIDYGLGYGGGVELARSIDAGDDATWCEVRFVANLSASESNTTRFYAYFDNLFASAPSYPNTFANSFSFSDLESDFGDWSNVAYDDYDWTRDQGGTVSTGTGPDVDHTLGTATGWYMYTESSTPVTVGDVFIIEGPVVDAENYTASLDFWYHMLLGTNTDTNLSLDIYNGSWNNDVWTMTGNKGNTWYNGVIALSEYSGAIKPRFRVTVGSTGSTWQNDVALDDLDVTSYVGVAQAAVTGVFEDYIASTTSGTGPDGEIFWSWSTLGQNYGNYTAISVATKSNFSSASDYSIFEIIPDITPPNVTLTSPPDLTEFGVGEINFEYTPYDINLDNCTFYIDEEGSFNDKTSDLNPDNNVSNSFTNIYVGMGVHEWNVLCFDTEGNSGFASFNFSVNVTGPDLTTQTDYIWFSGGELVEGLEQTVFANITNIGLTDNNESFIVEFWKGDPNLGGYQIDQNRTIPNLTIGEMYTVNATFNLGVGANNIFVIIDSLDTVNESDESNNKINNSLHVSLYNYFYGNFSKQIVLASSNNESLYQFFNSSGSDVEVNVYFADADSSFSFTDLKALGRNTLGSPTGNDFTNLDVVLNTTTYEDSIKNVWGGGTDTPLLTESFNISGTIIDNVPVVNSTNTSNFRTGILWDSGDDISTNLQYDESDEEDIIFVTKMNYSTVGAYGEYDYEIKVPALLRDYDPGVDTLAFYTEII